MITAKVYNYKKIVSAFRGMHVSPAKHSFGKCDRRTDRQTARQTDDGQSDPYVSLCFAGDTKIKYNNTRRSIPTHPTFVDDAPHDLHL